MTSHRSGRDRFTAFVAWCITLWDITQVELHGRYALGRLHALHTYQTRQHWLRIVFVCLWTPLPAIVMVTLLDCIQLESIGQGPNSPRIWIRIAFTAGIVTALMLNQCQSLTAWMRLTPRFVTILGTTCGLVSALMSWQLALIVGYPLPFTMLLGTPAVVILVVVAVFWSQREYFREVPNARHDIIRYYLVLNCQFFMTIVYPLFNHAFTKATSTQQTALVLLLPVIKTTCKLWIHHALKDTQDTKPEVIIFNVEVFHALFVAHCMQNSTSTRTVLVLVAFDLAHGYLSFMDVRRLLNELRRLNPKSDGQDSLKDILEAAIDALRREPELFETTAVTTIAEPRKSIRLSNQVAPEIPAVPKPAPKMADLRGPSRGDFAASFRHIGRDQRRLFVKKVLELLYLTEFIVFIEYTEVIVPVIYSVYSLILSYMWNREYYMFLHGWSAATFLDRFANISLYVLAEALSLVLMAVVLWWYLRFSLVHQLAFNLETRQVHIQSKLVGWVICIVQNAMVQYGADYSFQFEWLRSKPTS